LKKSKKPWVKKFPLLELFIGVIAIGVLMFIAMYLVSNIKVSKAGKLVREMINIEKELKW
jgi:Tfp pilus assembly protein PilE